MVGYVYYSAETGPLQGSQRTLIMYDQYTLKFKSLWAFNSSHGFGVVIPAFFLRGVPNVVSLR